MGHHENAQRGNFRMIRDIQATKWLSCERKIGNSLGRVCWDKCFAARK